MSFHFCYRQTNAFGTSFCDFMLRKQKFYLPFLTMLADNIIASQRHLVMAEDISTVLKLVRSVRQVSCRSTLNGEAFRLIPLQAIFSLIIICKTCEPFPLQHDGSLITLVVKCWWEDCFSFVSFYPEKDIPWTVERERAKVWKIISKLFLQPCH